MGVSVATLVTRRDEEHGVGEGSGGGTNPPSMPLLSEETEFQYVIASEWTICASGAEMAGGSMSMSDVIVNEGGSATV